jgi:hypothetical protein
MSVSCPHTAAFVAGNDPPLIDGRDQARGRSATEGWTSVSLPHAAAHDPPLIG